MADRRTVLRTGGGLLVGGGLTAVAGCTDELDELSEDIGDEFGGGDGESDGNESSDGGDEANGGGESNGSGNGETDEQISVEHTVEVVSAAGETGTGIETISLMVSLAATSDPVDLSTATFAYEDDESELFVADDVDDDDEADVEIDRFTPGTALESFDGLDIRDVDGNSYAAGDLEDATLDDETLEIVLDLTENETLSTLDVDSVAGFAVISAEGELSYELLRSPSTIHGEAVRL